MDGTGIKWLVIGTGAAVAGLVAYKVATKGAAGLKTLVTETFNPASERNIVNQVATAAGAAITGDKNFTPGGALYDATHADPMATMAAADAERARASTQSEAETARLARQDATAAGYATGPPESSAPGWMFGGFYP